MCVAAPLSLHSAFAVIFTHDALSHWPMSRSCAHEWCFARFLCAQIDGDGDLDVFAATGGTQSGYTVNQYTGVAGALGHNGYFYFNDGTGFFSSDLVGLAGEDDTHSVALGDIDGDADVDLLMGSYGNLKVWTNNGAGSFSSSALSNHGDLSTVGAEKKEVSLGDFDGDYDLDAIIGGKIYLNDNAGAFTLTSGINSADIPTAIAFLTTGDVDSDGDLDIIIDGYPVGAFSAYGTLLFKNDGSGNFTLQNGALSVLGQSLINGRAVLGDFEYASSHGPLSRGPDAPFHVCSSNRVCEVVMVILTSFMQPA